MATLRLAEFSLELRAPHAAQELRQASSWLNEHGSNHDIPAEQQDRLDLFLNEALANVMDHGGPVALSSPIRLHLDITQWLSINEATITISDAGVAFNPLTHTPRPAPQSLDDAEPGGLGIPMIRSLADDLRYQYHDKHNYLAFTVRWNAPSVGDSGGGHETITSQHSGSKNVRDALSEARQQIDIGWLPLFQGTDQVAVTNILNKCEVLVLPAGTPLLKPGESNDAVFVLLAGNLAAYLDSDLNPNAAISIAPGECIGEISAIDGKPVTALVLAVTEARVLKLTPDMFLNQLLTVPGVARNLLLSLTERMRNTNDAMMEAQRRQLALQHLHKELEVARQLQASMLPLRRPMFPDRSDLEIAALMEPASEVGGDLFDAFFVDDDNLFVCIGDVSGHGIPAALFMARSIGLMRIAAMSTHKPEEVIKKINDQLCAGNDTNLFVTLFCGFLNVTTGRLVYSNGGHCAPILISNGHASSIPIPKGTLVGTIPDLRYSSLEMTLATGDTLVCYTDGVTEAQPPSGEEYSEERLVETLRKASAQSTDVMMDTVRREVTDFTGNQLLDDDYTLLAIRRLPQ